jgi:hypothetical protein
MLFHNKNDILENKKSDDLLAKTLSYLRINKYGFYMFSFFAGILTNCTLLTLGII